MIEHWSLFARRIGFWFWRLIMLLVWGGISFHNLPVDAYPDVADNYVNIITQWPGHSAEDIEKQSRFRARSPWRHSDMKNLRSFSLAGISSIMMNFSDSSDNSWNRERVLERLSGITLPANLTPSCRRTGVRRTDLLVHP